MRAWLDFGSSATGLVIGDLTLYGYILADAAAADFTGATLTAVDGTNLPGLYILDAPGIVASARGKVWVTATPAVWSPLRWDETILANAAHGGAAATFETAAGVLAQESAAGAVETVAGAAQGAAVNAQTAALRAMMQEYLSVERWTGLSATIISGTLALGQRITVYHAPNDGPSNDQIIAHIESDGTVTFDGIWTPPAELDQMSVLKLEHDTGGVEIADPVVITLTIASDEEPQGGSTVTVTVPGTNAAGDDRCWWVKPDGTLVRCNGGHIVPDSRLTQAAAAGGGSAAAVRDATVTVE